MRTFALVPAAALVIGAGCGTPPSSAAPPMAAGPVAKSEALSVPHADGSVEDKPALESGASEAGKERVEAVCRRLIELVEHSERTRPEHSVRYDVDLESCVSTGLEQQKNDPEIYERVAVCTLQASTLQDSIRCFTESSAPQQDAEP